MERHTWREPIDRLEFFGVCIMEAPMASKEYLSSLARFYADAVDGNDFEGAQSLGEELAKALGDESETDDGDGGD